MCAYGINTTNQWSTVTNYCLDHGFTGADTDVTGICFVQIRKATKTNFGGSHRFLKDLDQMKFDLEMPASSSPEQVHEKLQEAAEQITHAQEVRAWPLVANYNLFVLVCYISQTNDGVHERVWEQIMMFILTMEKMQLKPWAEVMNART